jgi:sirohydrochlorin cobaltochelatase
VSDQALEQMLEAEFANGSIFIGEVSVRKLDNGAFELARRDMFQNGGASSASPLPTANFTADAALEVAKFDDGGRYRSLRTAPNLRRGWRIIAPKLAAAIEVLEAIYPGRLAAWRAWKTRQLTTTSLRATLNRQSGLYRVAAKISGAQIDDLVANFCRSNGGCLRTILWRRDEQGRPPSTKLPPEKFDPAFDQTGLGDKCIPLLCQEACNLLVSACREEVKSHTSG